MMYVITFAVSLNLPLYEHKKTSLVHQCNPTILRVLLYFHVQYITEWHASPGRENLFCIDSKMVDFFGSYNGPLLCCVNIDLKWPYSIIGVEYLHLWEGL